MNIEEVAKLSPLDRFVYWIRERHAIYLRRKIGRPKPWTDDEILQRFFFTNPYRENDRTTVWFRENVRESLRNDPRVLMATVIFRWFNYIPTGEIIKDLLSAWDGEEAVKRLYDLSRNGEKIFTGAYMISSQRGESKLSGVVARINNVWKQREDLLDASQYWYEHGMEAAHKALLSFDGLGGFMAYEIVCDLRYTYLLENAPDKMTWCNPGPGAIRGMLRVAGEKIKNKSNATSPPLPKDWRERMKSLLATVNSRLHGIPPFEMREVEHSLCEYDKYTRALTGDGRMKRLYDGGGECSSSLKKAQIAILKCLAEANTLLTRKQIAVRSRVDPTKVGDYAGPRSSEQSDKTAQKWQFPALDSLGYVRIEQHDSDGRDIMLYAITDAGTRALLEI